MSDGYETERLLDALEEYADASYEERKGRESSTHGWGYFGHREIGRRDEAMATVKTCLAAAFDAHLIKRGLIPPGDPAT
jgi:hypothetical protein